MRMHRPGKTKEYILENDRASDQPTIFFLRPLTWKQMDNVNMNSALSTEDSMKIHDIYSKAKSEGREISKDELEKVKQISPLTAQTNAKVNQQHALACTYGIESLSPLFDSKGESFELKPQAFIEAAEAWMIREIGSEIIHNSHYKKESLKN